jgi:predicted nucleotidyltransferase component of viral defense system
MAAIFNDRFLGEQVAMRGGTLLHKVYLAPPSRFSEDIDLVVFGDRPEDHIRKALRRVLTEALGSPKTSVWSTINLAVRNAVRPSRILHMTYSVPLVMEQGPALQITVEVNVTERTSHSPIAKLPFAFPFRRNSIRMSINGYEIHEMLGTKMRALFQRRRGRDLFDLFWALERGTPPVDSAAVVDSFLYYLRQETAQPVREEFIAILNSHLSDLGFGTDTDHLLRTGVQYDPYRAGECVKTKLLNLLPEK